MPFDFGRIVHEVEGASMSYKRNKQPKPQHAGLRLRSPATYDLTTWLFTAGRPRRFRERMLSPARLKRGERVLDVSCGTGSLALLASEKIGPAGEICGVDASEEMIAYARRKARQAGVRAAFDVAPAQELPFEDASFDVILNTLALHHLPKPSRSQAIGEMRRVLKPGGRALVIDFAEGTKRASGLFGRLKHRHGSVPPEEIASAMGEAGFDITERGDLGLKRLSFVLARAPGAGETEGGVAMKKDQPNSGGTSRRLVPFGAVALALLVLAHTAVAASFGGVIARDVADIGWKTIGAVAAAFLVIKLISHVLIAKVVWRRGFHHRR